jgi:hypothetical protein
MASKISEFFAEKKIDARRILIASKKIEGLQPEDRTIRLKERVARHSEDGMTDEMKKNRVKPRSGRPVTKQTLAAAIQGKSLSGPQKTRILRAINHVLQQRKQDPVDLRVVF